MTYLSDIRVRLGEEFRRARGLKAGQTVLAATPGVYGSRRLSEATTIPRNTISMLEKGEAIMTMERAQMIATALHKDVDVMLPTIARVPSKTQQREARAALADVPLDILITVCHAAGLPATSAFH